MELVKAITETSSLIASAEERDYLFRILTERTCYETGSDFSLVCSGEGKNSCLYCSHGTEKDYTLNIGTDLIRFIGECNEYVLSGKGERDFFSPFLLKPEMMKGVVFPLRLSGKLEYMLILNTKRPGGYDRDMLSYIDSVSRVAAHALGRLK